MKESCFSSIPLLRIIPNLHSEKYQQGEVNTWNGDIGFLNHSVTFQTKIGSRESKKFLRFDWRSGKLFLQSLNYGASFNPLCI